MLSRYNGVPAFVLAIHPIGGVADRLFRCAVVGRERTASASMEKSFAIEIYIITRNIKHFPVGVDIRPYARGFAALSWLPSKSLASDI